MLQWSVSVGTLRVVLQHARMSGALHFLHVAADDFGTCLADTLHGKRGAGSEASARLFSANERDFLRRRHFQYPQGPRAGSLRQVQAAEVSVVFHSACP